MLLLQVFGKNKLWPAGLGFYLLKSFELRNSFLVKMRHIVQDIFLHDKEPQDVDTKYLVGKYHLSIIQIDLYR